MEGEEIKVEIEQPVTPVEAEAREAEAEAEADAVETVADASVQIAEIEANRDVAIAEIHAEVASEAIQSESEEDTIWRLSIEAAQVTMSEKLGSLEGSLLSIQEQLAAMALPPSPPNPPSVEEEGPLVEEPEAEPVPAEPPRKVKRSRWI